MIENDRQHPTSSLPFDQKISRRSAIRKIGGASFTLGIAFGAIGLQQTSHYLDGRKNKDPYVDISNYRFGYPTVSEGVKERLISSIEKVRVKTEIDEYSDEEIEGKLYSNAGSPHILLIRGETNPTYSLNVVELTFNEKNIIVPLIQSTTQSQACIYLGNIGEEEEFSIKELDIPFPNSSGVESLSVDAFSLSADPFTMGVIQNIPELYIRGDNMEDLSVTNDIPLSFDLQLRESPSTSVRLVEYVSIFSGEDGGSAPYPLIDREGRLTDNEAFAFTKMTDLGLTVEEAYQGKSHRVHVTNLYYDQPKTPDVGIRQQYIVETDNNMVRPGNETGRLFSYLPDSLQLSLGLLSWEKIRDRNLAMRTISIRESLGQNYLQSDDKYIQWFIKNELGGNDLILPFVQIADKQ